MPNLTDLPAGTIWPHLLESIERDLLEYMTYYADSRKHDVARGAETQELAACLADKHFDGIARALDIAGLRTSAFREGDRLVREIDPLFEDHRTMRWIARPAEWNDTMCPHCGDELKVSNAVYASMGSYGNPVTARALRCGNLVRLTPVTRVRAKESAKPRDAKDDWGN